MVSPHGFAILAYLRYLHVHCKEDVLPSADELASRLYMSAGMAAEQLSKLHFYICTVYK